MQVFHSHINDSTGHVFPPTIWLNVAKLLKCALISTLTTSCHLMSA